MALKDGKMKQVIFESDDIGVMLLESITKGLYHDPLNSVREYVQNEYDAGAAEIRIVGSGDTLKITGNGCGMSEKELYDAKRMGFSDKSSIEDVGFRGIGIWSGVAICDEILVSTKRKEDLSGYVLKIDAKGLRLDIEEGKLSLIEALSQRVFSRPLERAEFEGKKGTSVELRRILGGYVDALSEKELIYYARQILPVSIDPGYSWSSRVEKELHTHVPGYRTVRILVNDQEVFRPPVKTVDTLPPVFQHLKDGDGRICAFAWFAMNEEHQISEESRFIIYKKRGFTVGDTSRSNVMILRETDRGAHSWATGEIHVIRDDIVPTSERIEFETNEAYVVLEDLVSRLLDDVVSRVRAEERRRLAEGRVQKSTDFKVRFEKTSDIRERLDLLIEAERLLRGFNNDLKAGKIDDKVKKQVGRARKRLDRDISFMAQNLGAPPEEVGTSPEPQPKRKTRRAKPKKVDESRLEEMVGEIAAHTPLDLRSRRLLAAVIKALQKTLDGNEKKMRSFVDNLKEELKSAVEGPK